MPDTDDNARIANKKIVDRELESFCRMSTLCCGPLKFKYVLIINNNEILT